MSSFYVHLPSNTPVEGNKTNSFKVRLPKTLRFNSQWVVGLTVIVYPHSWPTLGTSEEQWLSIVWKDGALSTLTVPHQNLQSPIELENHLRQVMVEQRAKLLTRGREPPKSVLQARKPEYTTLAKYLEFKYSSEAQRFHLQLHSTLEIESVEISQQLAYTMGFHKTKLERSGFAKFAPDIKGGISSLYVYTPNLIEPVIIGDTIAPVLRIVNVKGARDEMVEDVFLGVQYHKLLVKEVSEISVELRTPAGQLVPFNYGCCTLTLQFKKLEYM
jgi:hypothetical protein